MARYRERWDRVFLVGALLVFWGATAVGAGITIGCEWLSKTSVPHELFGFLFLFVAFAYIFALEILILSALEFRSVENEILNRFCQLFYFCLVLGVTLAVLLLIFRIVS